MKITRFLLLAALAGLLMLAVAACGDTAQPTALPTATSTTMAEPTATTAIMPEPTATTVAEPTATTAIMPEPTLTPVMAEPTATPLIAEPTATLVPTPEATATTRAAGDIGGPEGFRRVVEAMKGVRSYHFMMTMEGTGGVTSVTEGDVIPPDKFSMINTLDAAGQKFVTKVIRIGANTWSNLNGQWNKTDAPIAQGDPTLITLDNVSSAEDLGLDMVDGQAARRYRYATKDVLGSPATAEIWVDVVTGYMIQYKQVSDTALGKSTTTMKLSRFNDPTITIEPPQ